MAITVRGTSAVTAAIAPVAETDGTAGTPATPDPPNSPGFELPEEGRSRIGLGKRRAARSPSLERHDRAAAQAVKRRLTFDSVNGQMGVVTSGSAAVSITTSVTTERAKTPASPVSETVSGSELSSEWSPYRSPPSSEGAYYHALQDLYSAARTRVVRKISNNHLDSEDDSVHSATAEENDDANSNALDAEDVGAGGVGAGDVSIGNVGVGDVSVGNVDDGDADAGSTSDKENVPAAPTATYVAQLEAEIQALKGELAVTNELRAEEMDATRRTRVRLYQYIARVQGLAESMIVRDM